MRSLGPPLALLTLACAGLESPPPSEVRSTDLTRLQAHVQLPDGVTRTRFVIMPLGTPGGLAPGPTDYTLDAWLELDPEQAHTLEATWGPSSPYGKSAWVPTDVVDWVGGPWPGLEERAGSFSAPAAVTFPSVAIGRGAMRCDPPVAISLRVAHVVCQTM